MKTIRIAHLYYDLMNLYGENGNVLALRENFISQGVSCEVEKLTIGDEINLSKYDIGYIGSGSEFNENIVAQDIIKHKDDFKNAINNNKFIICTGNSIELFGNYIERINDSIIDCLGIFDFYAKEVHERIMGEQLVECDFLKEPLIGFQNRQCIMNNKENYLFSVINGHAENYKTKYEGIHYKNFIATYIIGPILIRNPQLTDYIVKTVLDKKNIGFIPNTNTLDYKAYNEYIKNFIS